MSESELYARGLRRLARDLKEWAGYLRHGRYPELDLSELHAFAQRFDEMHPAAIRRTSPVSQTMSEWISVEDRLPEDGVEVLAYDTDHEIYALAERCLDSLRASDESTYYLRPTHWMPLPEPPSASEDVQTMSEHAEMSDADLAGALREQALRLSGLLTKASERGLHVEVDVDTMDTTSFGMAVRRHRYVVHVTVERRETL